MQDDREGRARHTLKVYCLSRWSTEYKTVKDAENELISRLEVDGMPEQVLPLRVRMSACIMPARKESMHVFFNAYKCICARARTAVASERMWREECREARGSGTTLGDPLAGGSGEPLCTEARGGMIDAKAWKAKLPMCTDARKTWKSDFPTTKQAYTLRKFLKGLIIGTIDKNKGELWMCCPTLYERALEKMYCAATGYDRVRDHLGF